MRMSVFSARSWSDAAAKHHKSVVWSGSFHPSHAISSLAFGLERPSVAIEGIDGRFEVTVSLRSSGLNVEVVVELERSDVFLIRAEFLPLGPQEEFEDVLA